MVFKAVGLDEIILETQKEEGLRTEPGSFHHEAGGPQPQCTAEPPGEPEKDNHAQVPSQTD